MKCHMLLCSKSSLPQWGKDKPADRAMFLINTLPNLLDDDYESYLLLLYSCGVCPFSCTLPSLCLADRISLSTIQEFIHPSVVTFPLPFTDSVKASWILKARI